MSTPVPKQTNSPNAPAFKNVGNRPPLGVNLRWWITHPHVLLFIGRSGTLFEETPWAPSFLNDTVHAESKEALLSCNNKTVGELATIETLRMYDPYNESRNNTECFEQVRATLHDHYKVKGSSPKKALEPVVYSLKLSLKSRIWGTLTRYGTPSKAIFTPYLFDYNHVFWPMVIRYSDHNAICEATCFGVRKCEEVPLEEQVELPKFSKKRK